MFKFIHTADIHLDSPLRGLESYEDAPVDEIRGATRRAFDNLIELAIEEQVDFVLICGDLYDGDWKDYNTGLFFVSRIGKLARQGIRVFLISGNHDAASQITKTMPLPENVHFFSAAKPQSIAMEEHQVIIHGQSYRSRTETNNLAAGYPPKKQEYFNIGLLHTSLNGREGHEPYAPCTAVELTSKGYDYWALGHVHQREIVTTDPWIVFPGNIQGRHVRETGPKGVTLVTVIDNTVTEVRHQTLDVVRWGVCDIDMTSCETEEDIHAIIRHNLLEQHSAAEGRVIALRLQLTGRTPLHSQLMDRTAQWVEECKGVAAGLGEVWIEQVRFLTTPSEDHLHNLDSDSPLGILLQSLTSIELDEETLDALLPELTALKNKLPAALAEEPLFELEQRDSQSFVNEVRELLISRLLQRGRPE